MRITALSLLTILCAFTLSVTAFADLYNDGPTNGTSNAYFIDVYMPTDSFTVANNNSVMTSFTFAEWVPAGNIPLTVDWSVGTYSFGSDVASGLNAPISASLLCRSGQPFNGGTCGGGFGYDVYDSTVDVGRVVLHSLGRPFWLTLTGAVDDLGGRDAWDVNSGPSMAFHNALGEIAAESFTINGSATTTTGTTPEPSAILLFGSGVLGFVGLLRRKLL